MTTRHADLRWAALRCLLLDIMADAGEPPEMNGDRAAFERLVLEGHGISQIASAFNLDRDAVVAALGRLARMG